MTVSFSSYTADQQQRLLSIARQTLVDHLRGEDPHNPMVQSHEKFLMVPRGCFVTLRHASGRLRGCIGTFEQSEPLYITLMRMVISATRDPRIVDKTPVTIVEIDELQIDLSILTPMQRVGDPMEMRLGIDGICIRNLRKGHVSSGVFLPEVPNEQGWSVEQTLEQCCEMKMNLPRDAWRTLDDLEFYVFQSIKISEVPA